MDKKNYWVREKSNQLIFCSFDNSPMDELAEEVDVNRICFHNHDEPINLGIHMFNNRIFSSNYVGICRLKGIDGKRLLSREGKEVILKIEPRFSVSVVEMLNTLKNDDEFERYLAPQTIRISSINKDIEDLERNEVFHFFQNEAPIFLNDSIAKESSILTSTVFISMLKDLCKKPLMGKMVIKEENLTGKVRGKILFHKNIRYNTIKGRDDRLYCHYLQYSEDIIENQILKAALNKAKRFLNQYFKDMDASKNGYTEMIAYCTKSLEHIQEKKIIQKDCENIKTTGCYAYYKPIISVAKMVIGEISLESNGVSKVTSYVVPYAVSMSRLFELYVRAYLKSNGVKSYRDNSTRGIQLLKYDEKEKILATSGKEYANYISGVVKPDIILKNLLTNEIIVFDVKYKNLTNKRHARTDRLQLLAYAIMYNCSNFGIIFPTIGSERSCFYIKQKLESKESRERFYHQIQLNIKVDKDNYIISKEDQSVKDVSEYLEGIFQENL